MLRPCFLVIDREHSGTISTRKLVIETAKFNVITAYSGVEAIATLKTYPSLNGVVVDAGNSENPFGEHVQLLKKIKPGLPVIPVRGPHQAACDGCDYLIESFNPAALLERLQALEPEMTAAIARSEADLAD